MKKNKNLKHVAGGNAIKGTVEPTATKAVHRFVPCTVCGGSPDIHNTNRGAEFVGHEYTA